MTNPRAPSDLGKTGRALWRETVAAWELTPPELRVLAEACRTADELDDLRVAIREAPPMVEGSKQQPRPNPLFEEARRHREQLTRLLSSLKLPDTDEAAVPSPGWVAPGVAHERARKAAAARWGKR